MEETPRAVAVRAWLHSFSLLLKSVRLYGYEHELVGGQLETAWNHLRAALSGADQAGLLLGLAGSELLLDGSPLKLAPAERGFARFLAGTGLASIQFSPRTTRDDFIRFVSVLAGSAKSADLAEQLRAVVGGGEDAPIRVNEVRFVIEEGRETASDSLAAKVAAASLGSEAQSLLSLLSDPLKLIQLIVAAESAHEHTGTGPGGGPGTGPGEERAAESAAGARTEALEEQDLISLLRFLSQAGQVSQQPGATLETVNLGEQLAQLPASAQSLLRETLNQIVAAGPGPDAQQPVLLQLAENLAIRFALDRYEHGDVRVNAVRDLLHRMSQEIEILRQSLQQQKEQAAEAGVEVESEADILDRQFWASVPDSGKRSVLLSPEAWCIPPRNVRQFVEQLLESDDRDTARSILQNYAACLQESDAQGRRKVATGLAQLTDLYAQPDLYLLDFALLQVGEQLEAGPEEELQVLLQSGFLRLSREALGHRHYQGLLQAFVSLDEISKQDSDLADNLRREIGVEEQLPPLVEAALHSERPAPELVDLLRRFAVQIVLSLAVRLRRSVRCEERDRVLHLVRALGGAAVEELRRILRLRPPSEAAETVGLLSHLDPKGLQEVVPRRLAEWNRAYHDLVLHQLAAAGAPGRGALLVQLFPVLDRVVRPLALDEIGISRDNSATQHLLRLAEGQLAQASSPYLRVKAIEALGRLGDPAAVPLLRQLVEAKRLWRWVHPMEFRLVAAQALRKLDPAWAQRFLPKSRLSLAELALVPRDPTADSPWTMTRRYERLLLPQSVTAVVQTEHVKIKVRLKMLNLGGGLGTSEERIAPGTVAHLEIHSGWRPIQAEVVVREASPPDFAFDIIDIGLAERSKLRSFLARLWPRTT